MGVTDYWRGEGLPGGVSDKDPAATNAEDMRHGFNHWRIPWIELQRARQD